MTTLIFDVDWGKPVKEEREDSDAVKLSGAELGEGFCGNGQGVWHWSLYNVLEWRERPGKAGCVGKGGSTKTSPEKGAWVWLMGPIEAVRSACSGTPQGAG